MLIIKLNLILYHVSIAHYIKCKLKLFSLEVVSSISVFRYTLLLYTRNSINFRSEINHTERSATSVIIFIAIENGY